MRKALTVAAGVAFAAGGLVMADGISGAEPPQKVTICHGTASESNPYVKITVSDRSFKDGHFDGGPNNKSHGANNHPDYVLEDDTQECTIDGGTTGGGTGSTGSDVG
jgi:hypothetical protein